MAIIKSTWTPSRLSVSKKNTKYGLACVVMDIKEILDRVEEGGVGVPLSKDIPDCIEGKHKFVYKCDKCNLELTNM